MNELSLLPAQRQKRGGLPVMMVDVMKVAQQPAVAYDKVPLTTGVRLGKSGLLLKSLYVRTLRGLV
jgi:hypothetical protein